MLLPQEKTVKKVNKIQRCSRKTAETDQSYPG